LKVAGVLAAVCVLLALCFLAFSKRASESTEAGSLHGGYPKPGKPWANSLGMRFVPIPGTAVLFSIWETRVEDFAAYVNDTAHEPAGPMQSADASGLWKTMGHSWRHPEFDQDTNHPAVGMSWAEAENFCEWLTIRERAAGWISTNESYRLPTSAEWRDAAGTNRFAWGDGWPPPEGAGNFAGMEIVNRLTNHQYIEGYTDGYTATAPVGTYDPNALGIYDLAGNVAEYCEERDPTDAAGRRMVVGGSWNDATPAALETAGRVRTRENVRRSDRGFRCVLIFRNLNVTNSPAKR
jgi:formylglycine-generating enzyme required for sulfatase activity